MYRVFLLINKFLLFHLASISEIVFTICLIFFIKKLKTKGRVTAYFGFVLFFITMLLSVFKMDEYAGFIAEFVWISFWIAFVQEFYHFLKHENF